MTGSGVHTLVGKTVSLLVEFTIALDWYGLIAVHQSTAKMIYQKSWGTTVIGS
jgi:hypothetical protein